LRYIFDKVIIIAGIADPTGIMPTQNDMNTYSMQSIAIEYRKILQRIY